MNPQYVPASGVVGQAEVDETVAEVVVLLDTVYVLPRFWTAEPSADATAVAAADPAEVAEAGS